MAASVNIGALGCGSFAASTVSKARPRHRSAAASIRREIALTPTPLTLDEIEKILC
jgi:hypothetical protein